MSITTLSIRRDGILVLKTAYENRIRCRNIPDAKFDKEHGNVWLYPRTSLIEIEKEFSGEIYYKTPKWQLHGLPEPPAEKIRYYTSSPINLPEMKIKPYPYQEEGIRFCIDRLKQFKVALNGDGVGLGKTIQGISTMMWFRENKRAKKFLIVCKKSLKNQWKSEILKFTGWEDMPIFVFGDTKKTQKEAIEGINNCEEGIFVCNYHTFLHHLEDLSKTVYDLAIIDEAHTVKAAGKIMNSSIASVTQNTKYGTLLLTATLITSAVEDAFGVINLASKDYFGSLEEFEEKYIIRPEQYGRFGRPVIGVKNLEEVQQKVADIMIRRTVDDIPDISLPEVLKPKTMYAEIDEIQVQLLKMAQAKIDQFEFEKESILSKPVIFDDDIKVVEEINNKSKMYIATKKLIAADPRTFKLLNAKYGLHKQFSNLVPDDYLCSPKTEICLDLIESIVSSGEKLIICCNYKTTAQLLKEDIEKKLKLKVALYAGGMSEQEREINKDDFLYNEDYPVLIGTTAMNEGLNLQCCRYQIHFEPANSFAEREQRIGRIKRLGSKYDKLIIYDLLTCYSSDIKGVAKINNCKDTSDAVVNNNYS